MSKKPQTAQAWLESAQAAEERDDTKAALEAVDRALKLDARLVEGWRLKASLLLDLDRHEEAQKALADATERNPEDAGCWFDFGATLVASGNPEAGARAFERVRDLEPEYPRVSANLGLARLQEGSFAEALDALDAAVEESPDEARLWARRGEAALGAQQPQVALESFERALALAPDDYAALGNKGLALSRLSRPEPALQALDRALQLAPENARVWANKGVVLEQLMRNDEALAAFDRAIELDPKDPEAWSHKAQHLQQHGRQQEAEACIRQLLRLTGRLKPWGICLIDEGNQPLTESQIGVESDMPPDKIAQQYLQMLAQQGRQISPEGIVDGKYRIAMWELPPEAIQA